MLKDKRFDPIDIILGCVGLSNVINPVTWYIGLMWYCYLVYWICMKRRIRPELIIGGSILVLSVLFGNTSVNMWGLNAFSFSAGLYGAEKAKKMYPKGNRGEDPGDAGGRTAGHSRKQGFPFSTQW